MAPSIKFFSLSEFSACPRHV